MQHLATAPLAADLTLLLPWHASDALPPTQSSRIDLALRRNGTLAREFADVSRERTEIVAIHDSLGEPSPRALMALFAAIDAETASPQISS